MRSDAKDVRIGRPGCTVEILDAARSDRSRTRPAHSQGLAHQGKRAHGLTWGAVPHNRTPRLQTARRTHRPRGCHCVHECPQRERRGLSGYPVVRSRCHSSASDKVEAKFDKGVLQVHLPKPPAVASKQQERARRAPTRIGARGDRVPRRLAAPRLRYRYEESRPAGTARPRKGPL
jgi:hypothetical protein